MPGDPAKAHQAAKLTSEAKSLRAQLNRAGKDLLAQGSDWAPLVPLSLTSSHGGLDHDQEGILQTTGTQSVSTYFDLTFPASSLSTLSALRLTIFPDAEDPKKAPFRGSVLSHLTATLELADGKKTNIPFKEVISDSLTGPYDPMGSLSKWGEIVHRPARAEQWKKYRSMLQKINKLGGTIVPVMRDRPASATRETRLFARGSFISKEQLVTPGVPLIFNSMPKENNDNRLGMANWLTHKENPLISRVIVNRLWHECFGIGIVETLGDFGASGQSPSHLELLDHLALRFQNDHQLSLKKLLREIVLSSTYRQSHKVSQALLSSGLLSRKMRGPSVMPIQPKGIWQTVYSGAKWEISKGEDQHRRALYTYWRRTSPYPSLLTFDASSREICTARRITTNTPLQALVTLNDPAYLECAQALAKRMIQQSGDLHEQLELALKAVNSRQPKPATVSGLTALYQDALKTYQANPTLAKQLAATAEEAALILCANAILNTDEALTK